MEFNLVKCYLTKLATTNLAVKQSTSLKGQAVHELSHQAFHEHNGHPAVNPITDKCRLTWCVVALYTAWIFEFFVKCLCSSL